MSSPIQRLVVVSHSAVYREDGRLYAYGPYVKELNLWVELFPEVVLASPQGAGPRPADTLPIQGSNVALAPQPRIGGSTPLAKIGLAFGLPRMIGSLVPQLLRADAIHVRCPGNLGGLGALLAPLFCRNLVAKYAGQWLPFPGESLSSKLQRRLLASRWWRGPVTVYGDWPDQPRHVQPFFTSILSSEQVRRAARAAAQPKPATPLRLVFVGRLSKAKNVDVILRALARVRNGGRDVRLEIVGHGPQRNELEILAEGLRLGDAVEFLGGLPHDRVLDVFERSNVQILVSECEGWPKATAEAMAFGLIVIGSDRGFVPQMLAEGRGLVVPVGDADALADQLDSIAAAPESYEAMRRRAAEWGRRQSLDGLRDAIADLLRRSWRVEVGAARLESDALNGLRPHLAEGVKEA